MSTEIFTKHILTNWSRYPDIWSVRYLLTFYAGPIPIVLLAAFQLRICMIVVETKMRLIRNRAANATAPVDGTARRRIVWSSLRASMMVVVVTVLGNVSSFLDRKWLRDNYTLQRIIYGSGSHSLPAYDSGVFLVFPKFSPGYFTVDWSQSPYHGEIVIHCCSFESHDFIKNVFYNCSDTFLFLCRINFIPQHFASFRILLLHLFIIYRQNYVSMRHV